jgi:aminopeptidase N
MRTTVWASLVAAGVALAPALTPTPGADGIGDPAYPQDGNGGYRVSHYDVRLDYDPAKKDFATGDTTVEAVATQDLSRFDLDLAGFDVTAVTVNGTAARTVARKDEHELVITPAAPVRAGERLTVRVRYTGTPGVYWSTADDAGAVHVFGEPHAASSWYPVNDHPSNKATFRLAVTLPDNGFAAVANGRPEPPVVHDGRKTFTYVEDAPVASYLTGLAIDRFTLHTSTLPDGTAVLDAYTAGAEGAKAQEDRLPEVMAFLTDRFGPYPFRSVGGIFYPGDDGGGFEIQQRPVYPGGLPPKAFTTIVHEVAHQWFGNSVSVSRWRDICLKECFGTYAEWLWREAKEGHDLDAEYRATVESSRADKAFWTPALAEPGSSFYGNAYSVGPLMLHALRRTVGDDAFFRILRGWADRHRHGNASFEEFEAFAAQTSGRDLTGFFRAWAHSTTIPADQYLYPKGPTA